MDVSDLRVIGVCWKARTVSVMNLTRTGFIPTNGFDRAFHHDEANDENLSTSSELTFELDFSCRLPE